ncbi:MAG: DUF58 domain-containing protein [Alphaproteobacteria bacterium]|nr:DUF58 domain-containing protein [Alphaproteobacteria bacterium]
MAPIAPSTDLHAAARLRAGADRLTQALPPLTVAAQRVASTVAQGLHGRRRPGMGDAFWQFRTYQPGDTARSIDWRRSARGDQVFVRESEWEASQSLWLWSDASPGMGYGGKDLPTKAERAALLSLAMAILLAEGGERVALLDQSTPPRAGRAMIERLSRHLSAPLRDDTPSLPQVRSLPRHAQVLLFSDFLDPLDAIAERVIALQKPGVSGHMVQILDPSEAGFPFKGRVRFEDVQGVESTLIRRSEDVRGAFLERLEEHQAGLTSLARRLGWRFSVHVTDHPASAAVLDLYTHLEYREAAIVGGMRR